MILDVVRLAVLLLAGLVGREGTAVWLHMVVRFSSYRRYLARRRGLCKQASTFHDQIERSIITSTERAASGPAAKACAPAMSC